MDVEGMNCTTIKPNRGGRVEGAGGGITGAFSLTTQVVPRPMLPGLSGLPTTATTSASVLPVNKVMNSSRAYTFALGPCCRATSSTAIRSRTDAKAWLTLMDEDTSQISTWALSSSCGGGGRGRTPTRVRPHGRGPAGERGDGPDESVVGRHLPPGDGCTAVQGRARADDRRDGSGWRGGRDVEVVKASIPALLDRLVGKK